VARIIARCHVNGPRDERIAAVATPRALRRLWQTNLHELNEFVPSVFDRGELDEIGRLAEHYLIGREKLLTERIDRGLVVDGHGDLLGETVVLDGSFAQSRWRAAAMALAADAHADVVELQCDLPSDVAAHRLGERARRHADPSDADPAIARAMAGTFDPRPSAIVVDTGRATEATLQGVLDALDGAAT
jgi:hypothetical protein